MTERAVLYARYSSDLQSEASIEDQLHTCRRFAEREGWTVAGMFTDQAVSGSIRNRPGFGTLTDMLDAGLVDIVLAESLDRFSRDMEHIAAFHKRVIFRGARIVTLSEGAISELHVGLKGTMGALYLKDLAAKTHRGLEGRVRAGRGTGHPPYGYRVVRGLTNNGELDRGLREVNEEQAVVVRRIFREYAAGASPLTIAKALNAEAIPSPSGGTWYADSIRGRGSRLDGILQNPIYDGRMAWNRRRNLKDPVDGGLVRRVNGRDSHILVDVPHLRIVDHFLWMEVRAGLARNAAPPRPSQTRPAAGFWDRRRPRFLLTGKVICGACGRLFSSVGKDYLCCTEASHGTCRNRASLRRPHLEARVISTLRQDFMRPDLLDAFTQAFKTEWQRLADEAATGEATSGRAIQAIERKIENLVEMLSNGLRSPSIQARLVELEAQREQLRNARPPGRTPSGLPADLGCIYRARIDSLAEALAGGGSPDVLESARALIDRVVIHPANGDGGPAGVELIGDLNGLLRLAGVGAQSPGTPVNDDPLLAAFVCSVKAGPGAKPLAFLHLPKDRG